MVAKKEPVAWKGSVQPKKKRAEQEKKATALKQEII